MKDHLERLRDTDYKVRREVVNSLVNESSDENISLLIEALGDSNENVSQAAVKALRQIGDSAIPALIAALKHASWGIRKNAAGALVGLGSSFLDMLLDFAQTNDDDIQFWICEVISQFGDRAVRTLEEILNGDDMPRRLCALSALGRTGSQKAVKPLIECLSDEQWTIRKTAASSLIQLGQLGVAELIKLLNLGQPDLEFWAIQVLSEIGGEKSRRALIQKVLEDRISLDQKQSIVMALKEFESPEVAGALVQLLGDEDWIIRKQAAESLWEIGDIAESELGQALSSRNHHMRYWAARILGDLQANQYSQNLLHMMKNDETWSVRAAAAQALGEFGDEKVTLDLVDALRDSSEYVRKSVLISLNKLGEVRQTRQSIDDEWVENYTRSVFSDLKSRKTRSVVQRLRNLVEDVPDFPKPGIVFKDIAPLLASPHGLCDVVKLMENSIKDRNVDFIAGIEARGFIFGATLAQALKIGFIPLRKKGKLPGETSSMSYELEYGTAELEVQKGKLQDRHVVIVDDVLATGGTARAAAELMRSEGATVTAILFLVELDFLNGRDQLESFRVDSILHY
ncbi:adenine phosphoribosyltransferase [bacterium]|mgnify:CR=1 FL=1|jgi:adenine phosphoribosyltransferase|nr:adenine phosphoribosyltransferase [bacterium]